MRSILIFSISLTIFSSCQSKKNENKSDQDTTTASAAVDSAGTSVSQLTEAEKAEGWVQLFNGKNTDGWKIYKDKPNNSWEVVDGVLHCKPFDDADKRSDLRTVEKFENFELAFDWKISVQGNSGVMFRVTEEFDEPYFSGPEYQVIDDKGYPGDLKDNQLAGSNYDVHAAPADKKINAVGEWNSSKILANGNHIEYWLNGVKTVEYDINSPDWKKRRDASKWKDAKGYGQANSGYIDFQDHGNEVWFKNIRIKAL